MADLGNTVKEVEQSHKVLLFLANGYEDLEATAVLDTCGWTSYRPGLPEVRVVIAAMQKPVAGRFGTSFSPDLLLNEVRPEDYAAIAIPGGFDSHGYAEQAYEEALLNLIRSVHAKGGVILTMCVGILPVAEAGLLMGKRATTYSFSRSEDRRAHLQRCGATLSDQPVELDDRIISCSGPAHAVRATQLMLRMLLGDTAAEAIAAYMHGSPAAAV